jgi:hypothetical protein
MLYRKSNTRVLAIAVLCLFSLAKTGCADSLRSQKSGTLAFPADPPLVLQIDPLFRPLRPLTLPIDSLTNVDRRVFVHSDDSGTILRLVIVQFEWVQSGASFKFAYPSKPPAKFGAQTYRFGAYVQDDEAEAARSPAKEAGQTRAHLRSKGFRSQRYFAWLAWRESPTRMAPAKSSSSIWKQRTWIFPLDHCPWLTKMVICR